MAEPRLDINLILDTAAREFALHGFEGMSMRALAEKCSATAAAFYYHFSSKEALYEEVCTRIFDDVVTTVDRELKHARSPEERLERFVSTMFDIFCRDNSLLVVLTQRDVINATISPNRSFASPHHKLLLRVIHKLQSQYFGNEVDGAVSYAFESMLFGYCSLLVHSHRESKDSWEEHRARRKAELLEICRAFPRANTSMNAKALQRAL